MNRRKILDDARAEGITAKAIAEKLGVANSTVTRWADRSAVAESRSSGRALSLKRGGAPKVTAALVVGAIEELKVEKWREELAAKTEWPSAS